MKLNIDHVVNKLKVIVNIGDGIYNVDLGDSGEGKTLLFKMIQSYCIDNNMEVLIVDYKSRKYARGMIDEIDNESDIVMCLDNADLYMDKELNLRLKKFKNAIILVSLKDNSKMPYSKQGYVMYSGNTIRCGVLHNENSNDIWR